MHSQLIKCGLKRFSFFNLEGAFYNPIIFVLFVSLSRPSSLTICKDLQKFISVYFILNYKS